MYYIGADLGTSGLKMILMDETGDIQKTVVERYPISYPKPGWSEQDPADWVNALKRGLKTLTAGVPQDEIRGIGIDGQMHGLVMIDANNQVIRPAILWNDTRTGQQVDYLNKTIGLENLTAYTGNIAFAGFTAPKILWVKEHEPENFKRIKSIMLPKDYLNFALTGRLSTDLSDASGALLLDVANKTWSTQMLDICDLTVDNVPRLYESYEVVGHLDESVAQELGLNSSIQVVAGAADNAAAAIGAGTVGDGMCNISIGTSGTVFVASDQFKEGENNAVHNFVHADGTYHFLGCMLSAASALDWWMKILESTDYEQEQRVIGQLGESNILFLPYLMGERSPHNDANARGAYLGLSMSTTRQEMTLAVLEGVTFGLRDSLEVIRETGIQVNYATLCGGGSKSLLWQKLVANILNIEVGILNNEEGPALGSAILAAVGDGQYPDVKSACEAIVKIRGTVKPDSALVNKYDSLYQIYQQGYASVQLINDQLVDRETHNN